MYNIKVTKPKESIEVTNKFIDEKRNWSVKHQKYKVDLTVSPNLKDCEIYWRGEFLILEHNGIIHYWDSFPYCFLKQATEFMELDKPKKFKTLDNLISFRMAIRQTEVNHCGYVDDLLVDAEMDKSLFKRFMKLARKQDKQHHGSHTF